MREYDDPESHFYHYIDGTTRRYAEGLKKARLEPSLTLARALAERVMSEAEDDYLKRTMATYDHNFETIMSNHRQSMDQIKHDGARFRLMTCPPIALVFAGLAWYGFSHPTSGGLAIAIIFTLGSLAFLAMLVLGAIFDKPGRM